MKTKTFLLSGVAATMALSAVPANAATIVLVDQGGVTGSAAEMGFNIAAKYWGSILSNNVTIRLGVGYAALAPNVIGSTSSRSADISVANWEARVNATKSNSAIDQNIVLPTLNAQGGASFIANGVDSTGNNDLSVANQYYNAGASTSTKTLYENTAVLKAIGALSNNTAGLDGVVTFSSNFAFDFNPSDGITANTFDFIGVAIHEIGHALGFVSGVDIFDYYGGPNGPGKGKLGYDLNDTSIFTALDMFRYSNDPNNKVPGSDAVLDMTVGTNSFFSVDGGKTALFGNTFATGQFNGDGRQASHWKDTPNCQVGNGIMDPTFCFGQMGTVTGLDLAAFDAIGWNLTTTATQNYQRTSAQIYLAAIPEPATWAMMIAGFGFIGASMRVRRRNVSFAAA
ncbi:MAG: NF038122 family metalloprotease [Pseudomonadota bacterium]